MSTLEKYRIFHVVWNNIASLWRIVNGTESHQDIRSNFLSLSTERVAMVSLVALTVACWCLWSILMLARHIMSHRGVLCSNLSSTTDSSDLGATTKGKVNVVDNDVTSFTCGTQDTKYYTGNIFAAQFYSSIVSINVFKLSDKIP